MFRFIALMLASAASGFVPSNGSFVPNRGQWSSEVLFAGSSFAGTFWFTSMGLVTDAVGFNADISVQRLSRALGNTTGLAGEEPFLHQLNYIRGNDPDRWVTGVPVYGSVTVFAEGLPETLLRFENGLPAAVCTEPAFDVHNLRASLSQVDPFFSTYLGGGGEDRSYSIAVDDYGFVYVTGRTSSADFPLADPFQPEYGGGEWDAFVTKMNPEGTELVYSTFIGGAQSDNGYAIDVDAEGAVYLTGSTSSVDFPVVSPVQPAYGGGVSDAFLLKLSPSGDALVYSTFIGGSGEDTGRDLSVTADGLAAFTGRTSSTDFPVKDAFQPVHGGGFDAIVAVMSPGGEELAYSSFFGGSEDDNGEGVSIAGDGRVLFAGQTASTDLPLGAPFQGTYGGGVSDGFIASVAPGGSGLLFATYLGGAGMDIVQNLCLGEDGSIHLTGETASADFPLENPLQDALPGEASAFVTSLHQNGSALHYSTYIGGSGLDQGRDIAADPDGSAFVTGYTTSLDFPVKNAFQESHAGGGNDAFVLKLSPNGDQLEYSTYLGGSGNDSSRGIAVSANGAAYITGGVFSQDFPMVNPYQASFGGGNTDCFAAGFAPYSLHIEGGHAGGSSLMALTPNPFENTLQISVMTGSSGPVLLTVLDLAGRTVAVVNQGGAFPPGEVLFQWRPDDIPSGLYIVRAVFGNQTATGKVLFR